MRILSTFMLFFGAQSGWATQICDRDKGPSERSNTFNSQDLRASISGQHARHQRIFNNTAATHASAQIALQPIAGSRAWASCMAVRLAS